eukprot:TRINITY_DN9916_c0_g1_i2.p1 TRINITY_DN9916_c0_g1~~TRINITY_DN9916_c0_g1_i2.p1  ORF type:complete len:164 (-),score=15.21 TRINITY_DN9916_c0_g1_i2:329-820(-)
MQVKRCYTWRIPVSMKCPRLTSSVVSTTENVGGSVAEQRPFIPDDIEALFRGIVVPRVAEDFHGLQIGQIRHSVVGAKGCALISPLSHDGCSGNPSHGGEATPTYPRRGPVSSLVAPRSAARRVVAHAEDATPGLPLVQLFPLDANVRKLMETGSSQPPAPQP